MKPETLYPRQVGNGRFFCGGFLGRSLLRVSYKECFGVSAVEAAEELRQMHGE